jgi:hypothetical protein
VVRRLALIARSRLSIDHYEALARLANAFGGPNDFLRACDYVRGALASVDRDRQERKADSLQGKQRVEFVERCVEDVVMPRQGHTESTENVELKRELKDQEKEAPVYRKTRLDVTAGAHDEEPDSASEPT